VVTKRLDCDRFSGAFRRTKPHEPSTAQVRTKSGGEPPAVQTLRDHRPLLPVNACGNHIRKPAGAESNDKQKLFIVYR